MILVPLWPILLVLLPSGDALPSSPLDAPSPSPSFKKSLLPLLPYDLQTPHPPHPARLGQSHTRSTAPVDGVGGDNMSPNDLQRRVFREETHVGRGKTMFAQGELAGIGRRDAAWDLQVEYSGTTFFDGWEFFNETDPSHGLVTYVDADTAFSTGLTFWTSSGVPGIQVDHWSSLPVGTPRNSVRLQSKDLFAGGLTIIDLALMPWGCGVWPAFWTLGYDKTWPDAGEVDIIEGIMSNTNKRVGTTPYRSLLHLFVATAPQISLHRTESQRPLTAFRSISQMTIHTLPGCTINQTAGLYTGTVGNQLCDSTTGGSGSSISSNSATSYGEPFNSAGGGVFACLWDTDGIRIWNWNRAGIPSDISSKAPDPTTWGTPAAAFDASTCDPGYYFGAAELILNIDLCGDWAGNNYAQYSYCPGTCASYISDPTNLNNTIFLINYIRVFQQSGSQPLNQQVDVVSNLTGAGGAVGISSAAAAAAASASASSWSGATTKISTTEPGATSSGKVSSAGKMRASAFGLSLGLILLLVASGSVWFEL